MTASRISRMLPGSLAERHDAHQHSAARSLARRVRQWVRRISLGVRSRSDAHADSFISASACSSQNRISISRYVGGSAETRCLEGRESRSRRGLVADRHFMIITSGLYGAPMRTRGGSFRRWLRQQSSKRSGRRSLWCPRRPHTWVGVRHTSRLSESREGDHAQGRSQDSTMRRGWGCRRARYSWPSQLQGGRIVPSAAAARTRAQSGSHTDSAHVRQ